MAWDKTKPATNSALTSAEMRANWAAIETAFGPPDAATLQQVATNFLGAVTFSAPPTYKPGGLSTFDGTVSGIITPSINVAAVNNGASALEVALMAYTSTNLLSAGNKIVKFTSIGTMTSSANTKRLKAKWGATTIIDSTALYNDSNAYDWKIETWVLRTGAATQIVWGEIRVYATGVLIAVSADMRGPVAVAAAETLSGAVTYQITGQCGAAVNNIQQTAQWAEALG